MSFFPHPRRVVTGHDDAGNAIFVADSQIPCVPVPVNCNFAVLYETHEFPISNDKWDDPLSNKTKNLANDNGIVLRCVDFKPNTKTIFHRTQSLDFAVITEGEIVCYLDNGVEKALKAGDICVQRGTIHGWDNRTDKPARVFFVLAAAKPVVIGDNVMGDHGFDKKDVESSLYSGELQ